MPDLVIDNPATGDSLGVSNSKTITKTPFKNFLMESSLSRGKMKTEGN